MVSRKTYMRIVAAAGAVVLVIGLAMGNLPMASIFAGMGAIVALVFGLLSISPLSQGNI